MLAYKAVRRVGDKYLSLVAGCSNLPNDPNSATIQYLVGEWVEAKFGGLLCWGHLIDAMLNVNPYYDRWTRDSIWEAEVEEPVKLGICESFSSLKLAKIKELWDEQNVLDYLDKHGFKYREYLWPKSTIAYRRVKLVRKIAGDHHYPINRGHNIG